jgi:hypothetical protein
MKRKPIAESRSINGLRQLIAAAADETNFGEAASISKRDANKLFAQTARSNNRKGVNDG